MITSNIQNVCDDLQHQLSELGKIQLFVLMYFANLQVYSLIDNSLVKYIVF